MALLQNILEVRTSDAIKYAWIGHIWINITIIIVKKKYDQCNIYIGYQEDSDPDDVYI